MLLVFSEAALRRQRASSVRERRRSSDASRHSSLYRNSDSSVRGIVRQQRHLPLHSYGDSSSGFSPRREDVPLPNVTPVETTVAQIVSWSPGPDPTNTTPRFGRELTLYHIATAYLQNV